MKLLHLSDLHLGKTVNGFSMLEDQREMLDCILHMIDAEQPDALLLAGDLYDKSIPSAEAVSLFDSFLVRVMKRNVQVFAISGNHDSAERISFGSSLMDAGGVHFNPLYQGEINPYYLEDSYGKVAVYLFPFLRPSNVRNALPEEEISGYQDAMATVISHLDLDETIRNVAVAHQFFTWQGASPETCESEQKSLGGIDEVDAGLFVKFDYVALGHIHGPQKIGRETIRYSGSPLKYSFSEMHHKKSATLVEMGAKGDVSLRLLPIKPLRDMVIIRGSFAELLSGTGSQATLLEKARNCYCHIILTDEEDVPDAANRLRQIYPYFMLLDYDNSRTRSYQMITGDSAREEKTPEELFEELFVQQNNHPTGEEQRTLLQKLIGEIWRDEA